MMHETLRDALRASFHQLATPTTWGEIVALAAFAFVVILVFG
jgi:hypothetical protein